MIRRLAAALLFFGSGAASLGFQIAWTRMFGAGLGQEMPSVLAVIAAIFGGMAFGAWVISTSRRPAVPSFLVCLVSFVAPRTTPSRVGYWAADSPFLWYGVLEMLVGLWGLGSIRFISWANEAARHWIGLNAPGFQHWLVAFTIPALTLLPSTAAMGASFPVLANGFARQGWARGCMGWLYGANTAGAVAGVVLVLCWLLPRTGYAHGLVCLSGLSLACAAAAVLLSLRFRESNVPSELAAGRSADPRAPGALLIFSAGLLGIGYEVLVVRVLGLVLENTVYSYAAALAAFLTGTTLGAALKDVSATSSGQYSTINPKARRNAPARGGRPGAEIPAELFPDARDRLVCLLLALAAAVFLGIWTLGHAQFVFDSLHGFLGSSPATNWLTEFLTAASALLLPAAIQGALFTELLERSAPALGQTWAINTLGGALAPVLFGVVLLPAFGAKAALLILGGTAAVLTLFPTALRRSLDAPLRPGETAPGWPAAFPLRFIRTGWWILPLAALALALTADLRILSLAPGARVVSYRDGISDSVAVLAFADGNRSLLVNNRFSMGGTGAAPAEQRHGHIPLLLHPHPKRALFLGLGTGITFASAGPHPGLAADGVELVPEIVDALPWFAPQNTLPGPPARFHIYVADARRYVQACTNIYDVIVADLFHPARDGAGALYSLEHYRALRARLAPGGVMCQWLPLFQLDAATLRIIVQTFLAEFPDAKAFLLRANLDLPVLGLISGVGRVDPDYFQSRVTEPDLLEHLGQIRDLFQLLGGFVTDAEGLRRFAINAPLNTDDHPRVLFTAPLRSLASDLRPPASEASGLLFSLTEKFAADPAQLVQTNTAAGLRFADALRQFVIARNVYLTGLAAEASGDPNTAADAWIESARLSPAFSLGYAQALTAAMHLAASDRPAARRLLQRLATARPDRPVAAQLLQRLQTESAQPNPEH